MHETTTDLMKADSCNGYPPFAMLSLHAATCNRLDQTAC